VVVEVGAQVCDDATGVAERVVGDDEYSWK
jgi:hypothetical protein